MNTDAVTPLRHRMLLSAISIPVAVPADRRSPQPTIAQRFSALPHFRPSHRSDGGSARCQSRHETCIYYQIRPHEYRRRDDWSEGLRHGILKRYLHTSFFVSSNRYPAVPGLRMTSRHRNDRGEGKR